MVAAAVGLALATSFLASLNLTSALAAGAAPASPVGRARTTSSGVTLAVSDSYGVNVPEGSWVPVAVSVVNHRATDLAGQVVVSVPVAQVNNGQTCAASGMGIICGASFTPSSGYSASGGLPEVTYAIPLSLAAGISKQFVAYVLAESPYGNVHALIRTQSGTVLAKASAPLPVAYGTPQPAVLVVTESAGSGPSYGRPGHPDRFAPPVAVHRPGGPAWIGRGAWRLRCRDHRRSRHECPQPCPGHGAGGLRGRGRHSSRGRGPRLASGDRRVTARFVACGCRGPEFPDGPARIGPLAR